MFKIKDFEFIEPTKGGKQPESRTKRSVKGGGGCLLKIFLKPNDRCICLYFVLFLMFTHTETSPAVGKSFLYIVFSAVNKSFLPRACMHWKIYCWKNRHLPPSL